MIWIILTLSFLLGFFISVLMHKYSKKYIKIYEGEGWPVFAAVNIILTFFCAFFLFIATVSGYSNQINDFYDLKKIDQLESMYKEKAEALTAQFASYLAEAYPEHERLIFDKISPDKVSLYFVKYPDLKSSETMTALVGEISKLQADYYQQKENRINKLRDVEYRPKSPWVIKFVIPHYNPTEQ